MPRSFTVVVDTQEKQPWELLDPQILGREFRKLETGDYAIEGHEYLLCLERKRSVNELAGNIHQDRFIRELDRLKKYRWSYLLLEANMEDVIRYPDGADLPQEVLDKIRVNGAYLMRCLNRLQVKYNFNICYCGNRTNAQRVAINLMKEVLNQVDAESKTKSS